MRNGGPAAAQRSWPARPKRPRSLRREAFRRYRHPGIGWQLSVLDQLNEERAQYDGAHDRKRGPLNGGLILSREVPPALTKRMTSKARALILRICRLPSKNRDFGQTDRVQNSFPRRRSSEIHPPPRIAMNKNAPHQTTDNW